MDWETYWLTGRAVQPSGEPAYNCIAWSVGITDDWVWEGSSLSGYNSFYSDYGLVRVPKEAASVAVWSHPVSGITHGARKIGGIWYESKAGESYRFIHSLNGLNTIKSGARYGKPEYFYGQR